MRERPILFSAPMVRALLDGTKTQTRRVVKGLRPDVEAAIGAEQGMTLVLGDGGWGGLRKQYADGSVYSIPLPRCPYGVPGDRLWVRETWQFADWTEEGEPYIRYAADGTVRGFFGSDGPDGERLVATWEELSRSENYEIDNKAADRKWRPSIFMPRFASRLTLDITDVRVERLQEISEEDADAEGIAFMRERPDIDETLTAHQLYAALWDSINEKRAPWSSNPWVWVVSFKRTPAHAEGGE